MLRSLYRSSLALVTDLYELTMACGYWQCGLVDHEAVFHLFFRHAPFGGGFTVAAGLDYALEWLRDLRFERADLDYLATLTGDDGQPLFPADFLTFLGRFELACDVDAVPEGTVVFPQQPLLRVRGPLWQAQLLESALLNVLNFQSLVATKAARVSIAAGGEPVLEFGLRRAQGFDGALAASRAAFIGGCAATSNVLAGRLLGIPVRGTHAHSWVMAFPSEREAFAAWAQAMPNNAVFLVDTYDSLLGVQHAIEAGRELASRGYRLAGIRLDSGDLAYLSREARKLLDGAGFTDTRIVSSNDLDEQVIGSLEQQQAAIDIWGVGTRLVTAYDQPALGGVYKLSSIRAPGGAWEPKLKLSEQSAKISTPGHLQVRRYAEHGAFVGDAIYDEQLGIPADCVIVDPLDHTRRKHLPAAQAVGDLLVPAVRGGGQVYVSPPLPAIQEHTHRQLAGFHAGIKRFVNPHTYPVGLERQLFDLKTQLILDARAEVERGRERSDV
jgi:nicotinate phosphoribosyltransferase